MESQFCLLFKCYAISEFSGHIVMSLFSFQCDTHGTMVAQQDYVNRETKWFMGGDGGHFFAQKP